MYIYIIYIYIYIAIHIIYMAMYNRYIHIWPYILYIWPYKAIQKCSAEMSRTHQTEPVVILRMADSRPVGLTLITVFSFSRMRVIEVEVEMKPSQPTLFGDCENMQNIHEVHILHHSIQVVCCADKKAETIAMSICIRTGYFFGIVSSSHVL